MFTLWPIRKLNKYGEFRAFVFCNLMLVFLKGCRIFSTTPRLNLQIRSDSKSVSHAVIMLSRTAVVALYLLLCVNRGEDNMTMNLTMPISSPHSQRTIMILHSGVFLTICLGRLLKKPKSYRLRMHFRS